MATHASRPASGTGTVFDRQGSSRWRCWRKLAARRGQLAAGVGELVGEFADLLVAAEWRSLEDPRANVHELASGGEMGIVDPHGDSIGRVGRDRRLPPQPGSPRRRVRLSCEAAAAMSVQHEHALFEVQRQLELDGQRGVPPLAPRARALQQARASGDQQAQRQA